jgi:hypothetical protein
MSEMGMFQQLGGLDAYFESVGFGSFNPVIKSQNMKPHQINSTTSRIMADPVVGFTNRNTGVRISKSIPTTTFGLALFSFALSLTLPSADCR